VTKVQQIRQEYKEPFRDVVASFAALGYSRKATAQILEINPSWFDCLCDRFHLKSKFDRSKYNASCKAPGLPKGAKIKRGVRFSDEQLLTILAGYSERISGKRFNYLQGSPCADTIIKRFGSWRKAKGLAHADREVKGR